MLVLAFVAFLFFNSRAASLSPSETDVVIFGDSNTWLGGDDCTGPKGWNTWFVREYTPRSCRSYARSGATWTNTPLTHRDIVENIGSLGDNNVIFNQTERLLSDLEKGVVPPPGLVIIAAGTNDVWFHDSRQGLFSMPVDSLRSVSPDSVMAMTPDRLVSLPLAMANACLRLRRALPDVRIVVLTPLQSVKVAPQLLTRLSEEMQYVCALLGVDCIRQDQVSPVSREVEIVSPVLTYDGTHTSEKGAQTNGIILARIIRALTSPDL